jgi:hypothetical protein
MNPGTSARYAAAGDAELVGCAANSTVELVAAL